MLSHLYVKNFQSHDEALLELVPGINAIIGEPNSGKSALLRAFQWIATNRPLGDGFIRRGTEETRVQAVMDRGGDPTAVTRVRGKKDNSYSVVSSDQDATFTAFGNTPPDNVTEVLNLSELNYQPQLSSYFLVFDSPGSVAGYIRSATGLEDVKKVIDVLARKHRVVQGTIREKAADLEGTIQHLEQIQKIDTDGLASLIQSAEKLQSDINRLKNQDQTLSGIIQQLQDLASKKIYLPEQRIKELNQQIDAAIQLRGQLSQRVQSVSTLITNLQQVQTSQVHLPESLPDLLERKKKLVSQYNTIGTKLADLDQLLSDLRLVSKEKDELSAQIATSEKDRDALKEELSICPSCGSELTEQTKEILLRSS